MMLLLLACSSAPSPSPFTIPGAHELTVRVAGDRLTVPLWVPDGDRARTLAVVLHGSGNTGPQAVARFGYGAFSDLKGIVVAAPTAEHHARTGKTRWNSGQLDDVLRDDVALLEALATQAKATEGIDRVVAIGFSNGAQMAQRWACEGTQLNAMVTMAGTLAVPAESCRSVSVLTYVGDQDPRRTSSPSADGTVPSVVESMDKWKQINGCSGAPREVRRGQRVCQEWSCTTPTQLCVVRGLAHAYPTPKNAGVDANEHGWAFATR